VDFRGQGWKLDWPVERVEDISGRRETGNAEGGKRKGVVFNVFLCIYCVIFSVLLFVDVFSVIVLSFGVATHVTTCSYLLCIVALVATFSRCCVATLKQSSESKGMQHKTSLF
jgi:hypothetical protein